MNRLLRIARSIQRYGVYETALSKALTLLDWLGNIDRLEILLVDETTLRHTPPLPDIYTAGFMDDETLRRRARADPQLELSEAFLEEALAKGDLCYGISHGEQLVSYGWYSWCPTRIEGAQYFHFDGPYVYMYKGLTRDGYRGERLHAIGMARALQSRELASARGLVSFVDRSNLASLKSVYRMGYRRLGSIITVAGTGWFFSASTPGCRKVAAAVKSGEEGAGQPRRTGLSDSRG